MDRFSWLLKKRSAAVGLFNKVVRKLDQVHEQMHEQVEASKDAIKGHESAIKQAQEGIASESSAIEYLEKEKARTLETRNKITDIIGLA